jgi:hypothetical protein
MKKTVIEEPMQFGGNNEEKRQEEAEPIVEPFLLLKLRRKNRP